MKTKIKFENIKGMLRREDMKAVIGGDAYQSATNGGGYVGGTLAGTTLSGAQNTNLGITNGSTSNYATTVNYGAGLNGSAASGNNSTTGGSSTTGANTYINAASTGSNGSGSYAKP
ncbi:hypothetical protein [Flavobacterium granuli]|uniref:Bacteriocin-type signal sequence-containing protein n=1 Tax=Flavobacterium granuli TaxID=280093 RepID=A0ABU1S647_9FLAO|nr:hypothetical protein [Flavobacterium granuli]MDR6845675.1 hypothetical protein [Flavobacterium granuli]